MCSCWSCLCLSCNSEKGYTRTATTRGPADEHFPACHRTRTHHSKGDCQRQTNLKSRHAFFSRWLASSRPSHPFSMEKDTESHRPAPISHFHRVLHQSALNPDIQNAHYEGSGTEADPFVVAWLDHDPVNPMNYSSGMKWGITMLVACATLVSSSMMAFGVLWGDDEV